MRPVIVTLLMICGAAANGQDVRQYVTAQAHAEHLAATGTFAHCSRRGGGYEGLGIGSTPDLACRNACYWGQRRVREIGTAWSAAKRMWIAVVRYD